ncbi:uncharacterized protein LOC129292538 [Prosopis cineraria]|uniref:uncharacterized protein LOC129292538 n=1 Tax=Prosopis cineraria TaxID=364024 RepID=UPI0024107363|nr:uncharacterized protein LOC129292538 [Prosopis cineraria]
MKRKFETAEEEHGDFLALSLSSSSSSSLSPPKPSLSSPPLSLPLQYTSFPSSSHSNFSSAPSSSNLNHHDYSIPMQNTAYPERPFFPPSITDPLFFLNPQQVVTEPVLSLPATQPYSSLNPNPSRRRISRNPNPHGPDGDEKSEIPTPFPWGKNRRAMVQSLRYLRENQILTITGMVQCKTCESSCEMGFDLEAKFAEVSTFFAMNECNMYDRAPRVWTTPILPICKNCGNSVRPVVSEKKRSINWLFLFLGQMLGCCTLEQLKYFCKHNGIFRTGSKDRILYLTYIGLGKQVDPTGPFGYHLMS